MQIPTSENKTEASRRITGRSLLRAAWRWTVRGFALFGALVAFCWLTLDISVIVSSSMQPTLAGTSAADGDRVMTEKVTYWFRAPRRWEVITFTNSTGEKRMKRVVGLPGESVQMLVSNELLIDGRRVEPPPALDVRYIKYGNLMDGKTVPCGDGYYVLGDDLKDSDDSRFNDPIPASQILGRAWLIVWPFARMGFVN